MDDMGTVFQIGITAEVLSVVYGEDGFQLTPEELLEEQQKDINQDTDMGMNMGM